VLHQPRAHLLGCADCRALLEAEEALEALLATLPDPQLPPALTERVLARLATAREDGREDGALDALLALDEIDAPPADLAGDVLAALRPHRRAAAERLDRLLDRVPAPEVPPGLGPRTLRALERHRGRRRPQVLEMKRGVLALAAALLIAIGYATWVAAAYWSTGGLDGSSEDELVAERVERPAPRPEPSPESALAPDPVPAQAPVVVERGQPSEPARAAAPEAIPGVQDDPPVELLASLDLLESWDLLTDHDLELALASLDPVDEALLDLEGGI